MHLMSEVKQAEYKWRLGQLIHDRMHLFRGPDAHHRYDELKVVMCCGSTMTEIQQYIRGMG